MQPDIRSDQPPGSVLRYVVDGTPCTTVDVFGPTVEFLSGADDPGAELCVMRGVVRPGVTVPLHSHDDAEGFFVLSGTQQVLSRGDDQALRWYDVHPGDYVHIPGGNPHAHRNVSNEPAIELDTTTARLGRFSRQIAGATAGVAMPPTPDELVEFVAVATKYGYVLGTPDENAAVGIELSPHQ
jgi:quercetin dioxygenase-like cupin family protein